MDSYKDLFFLTYFVKHVKFKKLLAYHSVHWPIIINILYASISSSNKTVKQHSPLILTLYKVYKIIMIDQLKKSWFYELWNIYAM